ncbi:MAG: metallophosphoesterase [Mucilaginibacter sp.]|nr:metallophosphoesterase [Mucilaginibacter sp.]
MRQFLFIFFLLFSEVCCHIAFGQKPVIMDGPYVRYSGDQVVMSTIEKDDDLLRVRATRLPLDSVAGYELKVVPEENKDWAFWVHLRAGPNRFSADQDKLSTTHDLIMPSVYPDPGKLLFISDTEGEFGNLRNILLASGVMDKAYRWIFSTGGLVIAGDLFDRGKDVPAQLWLLYKLEAEARAFGGRVHVILGNHDLMNLSGDFRYVDGKYFKNAWLLGTDPAGLFGRDTELGRWLRSKNLVEKIGDVLVMHGGLSPAAAALKLDLHSINRICRPYLAHRISAMPDTAVLLMGPEGLPWYRGYFRSPRVSIHDFDSLLAQYSAKYMVVGHTILRWGIAGYYGGKLIGIDVDRHKSNTGAVLYFHGCWQAVDASGKTHDLPILADDAIIKDRDIL